MTTLFLAATQNDEHLIRVFRDWDWQTYPVSLLFTFAYIDKYAALEEAIGLEPKCVMLDSGAWSAYRIGKVIDIDALLLEEKTGNWDEVVALDVIGDGDASKVNADYMRVQGSNAFPVFHFGESWELLDYYCEHWLKVGLGCCFVKSVSQSYWFYDKCFAKQWPHLFHSFGWATPNVLRRYPFASADTSSCLTAAARYGRWRSFGAMSVRGDALAVGIKAEVLAYLDIEREIQQKWKATLAPLLSQTEGGNKCIV